MLEKESAPSLPTGLETPHVLQLGSTLALGPGAVGKFLKPPDLPLFSGVDPVPEDESSFEQWVFQVKGSLSLYTQEMVRSSIICSVRGEARKLVGFVGFQADLSDILRG